MSTSVMVLLFLAGIGAGLTGSIAGLASLFSYPALLAVGLSPLTANVTNTVALVFSSLGSGPELRDRDPDGQRGTSSWPRPVAWPAGCC